MIKEFNAKKEDFRDSADLPLWVQTQYTTNSKAEGASVGIMPGGRQMQCRWYLGGTSRKTVEINKDDQMKLLTQSSL